jgi:hypothetical protein
VAVRRPPILNSKGRRRTGRATSVPPCLHPKSGPPPSLRRPFCALQQNFNAAPCNFRLVAATFLPLSPNSVLSWQHPQFFGVELILNGMVQGRFAAPCSAAFQDPSPRSCSSPLSPSLASASSLSPCSLHPPSAPDLAALAPPRLRLDLRDGRTPSVVC